MDPQTGKYFCKCCGYATLEQEPPGTYDICSICDWEDDGVQFNDPSYEGGANTNSLRQERKAFSESGKTSDLARDPNWTVEI